MSAPARAQDWLDGRSRELDEEEAVLRAPPPTSSPALDRAMGNEKTMREVIAAHQREIAAVTASIAEAENSQRTGLFRLWAKRQPSSEFDKLHTELVASKSRLAECEEMKRQALAACREEQRRISSRADFAKQARPGKLADLANRRQAVEVLRQEIADEPWKGFGGLGFCRGRFDRIIADIREKRLNEHPADYKNRTDMWGIGQLRSLS